MYNCLNGGELYIFKMQFSFKFPSKLFPWRHKCRVDPFKVAQGYWLTCQKEENWRHCQSLIGSTTSQADTDWLSVVSGGAAVQGWGEKNRSEEDLVTVRF